MRNLTASEQSRGLIPKYKFKNVPGLAKCQHQYNTNFTGKDHKNNEKETTTGLQKTNNNNSKNSKRTSDNIIKMGNDNNSAK